MPSWIIIHLVILLLSLPSTFGDYPLICPEKPHWNLRAKSLCKNVDDYRCLWDANYHRFIEQCSELNVQRKGFRKVIEGDITAGDCTANSYQPRMWTSKGNYDCEFQKSLCNDIGQVIYEDGGGITDRTCGCNHTAGYAFLHTPKNPCYCVPSEEDCTCVKKRCSLHQKVDPEYKCRSIFRWKSWFSCPIIPCGSIKQTCQANIISSTISPIVLTNDKIQVSEEAIPNKTKAFIALCISLICIIGTGVFLLYKDSLFTNRLESAIVYEGETAILSCEVVDSKMTVSWFVDSRDKTRYEVYSYQRSRELLIKDVKKSENGMQITAMVGFEKCSATVFVKDSSFLKNIKNQTVKTGDTAVFCCELKDGTETVRWLVNGDEISKNKRYTESINGQNHELRIDNCSLEDDRMVVSVISSDREKKTKYLFVEDTDSSKVKKTGLEKDGKLRKSNFEIEKFMILNDILMESSFRKADTHIPQHIQEQFKKRIDNWKLDDAMFVPTQAAKDVMKKIKEHNFVVVTGNGGTGKTYTIRHTALMMEKEGYIIVPVDKVEDICKYFKHGCKTVFVFDDLCGRFTFNQNVLYQWKFHKLQVKTILKDSCCKILASCRLLVFNDERIKSFTSGIGIHECSVSSSVDEKKLLIERYFGNKNISIAEKKLSKFDFLPFLCSNLKNKNITEIETCFENPFNFFVNEFEILFKENDDGKRKCCALTLCVLYNNTLTWDELRKEPGTFCSVLKKCDLSSSESPYTIRTALDSLIGVYITNDDDTYKIIHAKLFDFIAKYFGEKMIDLFINFAESGFVRERFVLRQQGMPNATDYIEISEYDIKLFMERLVSDWQKGHVHNVLNNTNMESQEFRKRFLSHLKELDELIQRKLVQVQTNDETPLYSMCCYGDHEFAEWMLDLGADQNIGRKDSKSPLQIACQKEYSDLVKVLLNRDRVEVDFMDKYGKTALHIACKKRNVEIVSELIKHKADVNISMKNGRSPIIVAMISKNLEVVKELLKCRHIDVNHSANDGQTALNLACIMNNAEIVSELIQHKVDVNKTKSDGRTPLMLALELNYQDVVIELLKSEAIEIDYYDRDCVTALHVASEIGSLEMVKEIIKYNADVNRSRKDGMSPLMIACLFKHLEVVKVLLACKETNVNHSSNNGQTALCVACEKGNTNIVSELIRHNVDVNSCKKNGMTPLMLACDKNHKEVVKILLRCKQINVNHKGYRGLTAIYLACKKGILEIVAELIKCSVNINSTMNDGLTPLMIASLNNHLEVVKLILKCDKIVINHSSNDGCTALYLACHEGNLEIVNVLIQHKADVNRRVKKSRIEECKDHHTDNFKKYLSDKDRKEHLGQFSEIWFCQTGNTKVVRELALSHRRIDNCKHDVCFPLEAACSGNFPDVVKELLKCPDIEINRCNSYGQTALYWACVQGHVNVMAELLHHQADVNKSDNNKISPLHIACMARNRQAVKLLIEHGADKTLKDINGDTPLDIASKENDQECISILNQS